MTLGRGCVFLRRRRLPANAFASPARNPDKTLYSLWKDCFHSSHDIPFLRTHPILSLSLPSPPTKLDPLIRSFCPFKHKSLSLMSYSSRNAPLLLLLSLYFIGLTTAIPVDNGVEGEPEIECGPTSITVNFNTRNPFEGHVYVKGLFDHQQCRSDEHGRQAGIELPFDSCNVQRTRSLNPKGIFVSTVVVISFHPQFVTKVDRAYRVQCFYMEADKTVSSQLEVSEITTQFQTQTVPMPVCRYEILEGGPQGQPVQFATIGQQVYHKWTCDSETVDTFCAVVHSCMVDDGNGDTIQILNEEGCALDKFLLNNLEYPTDLMAGQEAHVYKYADRSQLFYQCQISISIKEPHSECPRPKCAEPTGFNAVKLGSSGISSSGASASSARGSNASSAPPPASAATSPPSAVASPVSAQPAPAATAIGGTSPQPTPTATAASRRPSGGAGSSPLSQQLRLLRKRRSTTFGENGDDEHILDVRTELNALDISEKIPEATRASYSAVRRHILLADGVCMSSFGFSMLIGLGGMMVATSLVILVSYAMRPETPLARVKV